MTTTKYYSCDICKDYFTTELLADECFHSHVRSLQIDAKKYWDCAKNVMKDDFRSMVSRDFEYEMFEKLYTELGFK